MDDICNQITTMNLGNKTYDQELQDMISEMEYATFSPASRAITNRHGLADIIPLEIANYFCKNYFDDEDFVYIKLELPQKILDDVKHSGSADLVDYISKIKLPGKNDDVLHKIACVYQYIIGYYDAMEYAERLPDNQYFPSDFVAIVNELAYIISDCDMDITTAEYGYLNRYNKELFYGLGLIVMQIKMITEYYSKKTPMQCVMQTTINLMSEQHKVRYLRLVNNFSVIMLYTNYYFNEFEDVNMDYPEIPAEWQLTIPDNQ